MTTTFKQMDQNSDIIPQGFVNFNSKLIAESQNLLIENRMNLFLNEDTKIQSKEEEW
jgi:hypothetical protein